MKTTALKTEEIVASAICYLRYETNPLRPIAAALEPADYKDLLTQNLDEMAPTRRWSPYL